MVIDDSIVIHAPRAAVWKMFTDVLSWKNWNSVLANYSDPGSASLSPENEFTWCIRPFYFPVYFEPVIEEIVPYERIVWRAKKFGIAARHEFFFKKEGSSIRLESRETFAKSAPLYFAAFVFRFKLEALTRSFLRDLKKAAECSHGVSARQNKDQS